MSHSELIGTILAGLAVWLLPILLPFFFAAPARRKVLFYFVGLAVSFLCYKIAIFIWAILCASLGEIIASLRHEDFHQRIKYSFALVAPGVRQGDLFFSLLPYLVLGTLFSVIALRILRKNFAPAVPTTAGQK